MSLIHFFAHFSHSDFRDNFHAFMLILLAVAMIVLILRMRMYSLKVQDRVIRARRADSAHAASAGVVESENS